MIGDGVRHRFDNAVRGLEWTRKNLTPDVFGILVCLDFQLFLLVRVMNVTLQEPRQMQDVHGLADGGPRRLHQQTLRPFSLRLVHVSLVIDGVLASLGLLVEFRLGLLEKLQRAFAHTFIDRECLQVA